MVFEERGEELLESSVVERKGLVGLELFKSALKGIE